MSTDIDHTPNKPRHLPVMLSEVLAALRPIDGGLYVDATFGAGGYTSALLQTVDCTVVAFDRDAEAISAAQGKSKLFKPRLVLIESSFGRMEKELHARDIASVDGIVFDLGVSSMQIDDEERGFSFQKDGPLDMRMEGSASSRPSAADIVNQFEEEVLANIFFLLGEEKKSRSVAKEICRAREEGPITTTLQLASIVEKALGPSARKYKIHPATRSFMALRIFVNSELEELIAGLRAAESLLRPGGRLVVVSFHSLEDRIVKKFMAARSKEQNTISRHQPRSEYSKKILTFNPVRGVSKKPSEDEISHNARARSSILRVVERNDEPVQEELTWKKLGLSSALIDLLSEKGGHDAVV